MGYSSVLGPTGVPGVVIFQGTNILLMLQFYYQGLVEHVCKDRGNYNYSTHEVPSVVSCGQMIIHVESPRWLAQPCIRSRRG